MTRVYRMPKPPVHYDRRRKNDACVMRNPYGPRAYQDRRPSVPNGKMTACHPSPTFIERRRGGSVPGYTCPLCTSVKDRRPCPKMKSLHQPTLLSAYASRYPHIFPPERDAALDTIYISHRVVARRHLAIAGFAFDDVHPKSAYCV